MISPIQTAIVVIAALGIAGAVANTYRLSAAVDRAHAELSDCQLKAERLQDTINEQNRAVERWKKTASDAQERAKAALAQVDERQAVVDRLTGFERRSDESECDATKRLILEYRQ